MRRTRFFSQSLLNLSPAAAEAEAEQVLVWAKGTCSLWKELLQEQKLTQSEDRSQQVVDASVRVCSQGSRDSTQKPFHQELQETADGFVPGLSHRLPQTHLKGTGSV